MNYFLRAFSKAFPAFVLLFLCTYISLHAQNWNQVVRLAANSNLPAAGINYGYTVTISGDYAAVQASGQSNPSVSLVSNAGAVYVLHFIAGNWSQVKVIYSPHQTASGFFGLSLALTNDYLVIGSQDKSGSSTAAYLYGKNEGGANQWGFLKEFTLPTSLNNNIIGTQVAISGQNIIIGNPSEPNAAGKTLAGSVSIYNENQGGTKKWGLVNKFTNSGAATGDVLGTAVSISGDYAVASAFGENTSTGAAYVYKRNSETAQWTQIKKLTSSTPIQSEFFGNSVSLNGEYVVVGAYGDGRDGQGTNAQFNAGSAYIFSKGKNGADNWGLIKKITASDRSAGDMFANSVSISGNYVVAGAPAEGVGAEDYFGAAYIFKKDQGGTDSWGEVQKLTGTTRSLYDQFGNSVSISGGKIITASPLEDFTANNTSRADAGVAYIIGIQGGLPVTLVSFEANKSEGQALLKWSTSSETNSDFFAIERSTRGIIWETLDKVEASQESTSLKNYSYLDIKPNTGENLYRLKMIDRDGSFAQSRIRSLTFSSSDYVILYPNPVSGRLYLTSQISDKIESVSLVNVTGQLVAQFSNITKEGLPISHLASGMYSVLIKKTDGSTQFQKVIVVR